MSRSPFRITPLSYDQDLSCASFDVTLEPGTPVMTTGLDVGPLFEAYPGLRIHRCDSGRHRSFRTEARQTQTVHLLEHLAVEILVASGVERSTVRGQTGIPKDDPRGTYRLRIYGGSSLEEMDALLHKAAKELNALILST
ncbi:MAG: hypothetical protein FWE51_00740 [Coriobacteriia bacterium]|nr:hypothetical protein [Coriobacteriia bacterium]